MPFHWYDIAILVGLVMLFFGAKRLPEMGSAVGKTIQEFRKSMREVPASKDEVRALPPQE
ncbi:MAG TPA: twin-arginine translocase TatA/TatE family subunit [Ktedonobacterales bacterium]